MKASMYKRRQALGERGLALPVVLIILAVMLVSCVYLMKSIHATTLNTGNLAYDATLSQSVDLGLHAGFEWLKATSNNNKALLNVNNTDNGYVASQDFAQTDRDEAFWTGKKSLTGTEGTIDYVIHRLCTEPLPAYDVKNTCMVTDANAFIPKSGNSLSVIAPAFQTAPQVHYVITARMRGAKGTSVTNQMIVVIGA